MQQQLGEEDWSALWSSLSVAKEQQPVLIEVKTLRVLFLVFSVHGFLIT